MKSNIKTTYDETNNIFHIHIKYTESGITIGELVLKFKPAYMHNETIINGHCKVLKDITEQYDNNEFDIEACELLTLLLTGGY